MGFLIKQNRLFKQQKFAITSLAAWILVWFTGTSYAQTVLSDEEMDQVYARGFFLDFDVSFGTLDDVMKVTSGGVNKTGQPGVVNTSSSNVKILSPLTPQKPVAPTSPLKTVDVKNVVTELVQQASAPVTQLPVSGSSDTAVTPVSSTDNSVASAIPSTFVQSVDAPVTSSVQPQTMPESTQVTPASSTQPAMTSSVNPGPPIGNGTQDVTTGSAIVAAQPQPDTTTYAITQQPVSSVVSAPADFSPVVDNTNISVDPASAAAGTTPAIKLDVVATQVQDGKTGLNLNSVTGDFSALKDSVAVPSRPDMPQTPETPQVPITNIDLTPAVMTSPLASGSSNLVVVDDLAQQHLSALVNVNAAGSVVPVLLNIVININSTVENLSTNNSLNLQNFYNLLQGNN